MATSTPRLVTVQVCRLAVLAFATSYALSAPAGAVTGPGRGVTGGGGRTLASEGPYPPPGVSGPPLGVSRAGYAHGRLRLDVTVPTSGTLTISIPIRGPRRYVKAVRSATHTGHVTVVTKVADLRFGGWHELTLKLVLHASIGFLTRTQTVAVH
jgi:hypothetical protein